MMEANNGLHLSFQFMLKRSVDTLPYLNSIMLLKIDPSNPNWFIGFLPPRTVFGKLFFWVNHKTCGIFPG